MIDAKGRHLIIEMNGATNLTDHNLAIPVFKKAVKEAGATLLNINMHSFKSKGMPEAGFTGVAALSESHMTIHTWPESDYAAVDIFMCGLSNPYRAVDVLKEYFNPEEIFIKELERSAFSETKITAQ